MHVTFNNLKVPPEIQACQAPPEDSGNEPIYSADSLVAGNTVHVLLI